VNGATTITSSSGSDTVSIGGREFQQQPDAFNQRANWTIVQPFTLQNV
jgi:hypothetical protein